MPALGLFLPALIFALACNLDTVLLAAGYALKGHKLPANGAAVIAAVTTVVTVLALFVGARAAEMLPLGGVHAFGSLILIFMGIWFLLDALAKRDTAPAPNVSGGSFAALCSLSAALGVNNAGAGVAAGISGVSPLWGGAVNFGVTLAALALGHRLGRLTAGKAMGGWALACSGLLLLLLGVLGLLS